MILNPLLDICSREMKICLHSNLDTNAYSIIALFIIAKGRNLNVHQWIMFIYVHVINIYGYMHVIQNTHIHNVILFTLQREQSADICYNLDGP